MAGNTQASAGPLMPKERVELLDRAWSEAADLYLKELAPRFDPWFKAAMAELQVHELPPGPILVPCCGPGQELLPLHALYGGQRRVVGLDLSRGMIDLARAAIAAPASSSAPAPSGTGQAQQTQQPVEAVVADATALDAFGPAAAIVSVFGLQQMGALAPAALANWGRCLAQGGVAVVVFWPSRVEDQGPWLTFDQVILEKAAADKGQPPPPPDAAAAAEPLAWEVALTEPLRNAEDEAAASGTGPEGAAGSGVEVLVDRLQAFEIRWPSAKYFWKVMTEGGPWRARRLAQGEAAMADLATRFADKYGGMGSDQYGSAPLSHTPAARVVVLRRRRGGPGCVGRADRGTMDSAVAGQGPQAQGRRELSAL
ncbi:hypothetical protein HYH02_008525 [Chlamydomonas schloesseri]|uniref:Methyltransferase domain-containing protein n=1 Tax=Chlamydomonas schloesseri TaxID=2026947 RepID=A0A835WFT0_9CHLO|nr:hypothetical protein HYH02_008525 [Chlamydomonas schloesseri]|eukprot:KAG2446538.1 hypothetical protein HYH02_008525 [Chlamydomonas schloesseri]